MTGTLQALETISGSLSSMQTISGTLSTMPDLSGTMTVPEVVLQPAYYGDYTITPGDETQELEVRDLRMLQNVVINSIPSNYGLITWNGSTLTVS